MLLNLPGGLVCQNCAVSLARHGEMTRNLQKGKGEMLLNCLGGQLNQNCVNPEGQGKCSSVFGEWGQLNQTWVNRELGEAR